MAAMMQPHQFLLPNPSTADPISSNNRLSVRIRSPNARLTQFHSAKSIITCARSNNKGFLGSQRQRKTLIRLARFAASNLVLHYVLPEPFNSVIREFGGGGYGGGGGGSGGLWKGFGWGGFDGGGGGRRRRVNKKSQLWIWGFAAVVFCLGFWWLNFGGKLGLNSDVALLLVAMCLLMLLVVIIRNVRVPEWVLGFCSGGFVTGLLLEKRDELLKFVRGFKTLKIK